MAQFSVKKNNMDAAIDAEKKLANELSALSGEIQSIGSSLSFKIAASSGIRSSLSRAAGNVSAHSAGMNRLRCALQDIEKAYENAENAILGKENGGFLSILSILGLAGPDGYQRGGAAKGKIDVEEADKWDLLEKMEDSDLPDDNPLKKTADKLRDFNDKHLRENTIKKGYYDEDGTYHDVSKLDKDSKEYKEHENIANLEEAAKLASVSGNASWSAWSHEGAASRGIASGSYSVSAVEAHAEGEAYAGLYSYDADGNKKFTPGFGANVGVGVSAFSAETQGSIGNEYFNVHGSASAKFLAAEAEAGANVGLYDKDGNFNPAISANASAEAILAEVSGTVGGTIAGTSVNATGSVNVGVGAHADIGYQDGKLSVDVGASLGLGVSVKFDIDFSGTFDFIGDNISSGASQFYSWIKG